MNFTKSLRVSHFFLVFVIPLWQNDGEQLPRAPKLHWFWPQLHIWSWITVSAHFAKVLQVWAVWQFPLVPLFQNNVKNCITPLEAHRLCFLCQGATKYFLCIKYNFYNNIMLFLKKAMAWAQAWAGLGLFRAEGLGSRFRKPELSKAEPSPGLSGRAGPAHHYIVIHSHC